MGKMAAVWGKNGAGKSVLAVNLSCALVKKNYKVALIGANRYYGSIQHYFGMGIKKEESLRTYFYDMMYSKIENYFIECSSLKNLYLSSQSNYDDCMGFKKYDREGVGRFLNLARECFDYIIIDCDESMDDALSMLSLTNSDKVVYVTRPTVQFAAFSVGFESLVDGLNLKEKMRIVMNYDKRYSDVETYIPFGKNTDYVVLPYCQTIEKLENYGKPIILTNNRDKTVKRYLNKLDELTYWIAIDEDMLRYKQKEHNEWSEQIIMQMEGLPEQEAFAL